MSLKPEVRRTNGCDLQGIDPRLRRSCGHSRSRIRGKDYYGTTRKRDVPHRTDIFSHRGNKSMDEVRGRGKVLTQTSSRYLPLGRNPERTLYVLSVSWEVFEEIVHYSYGQTSCTCLSKDWYICFSRFH